MQVAKFWSSSNPCAAVDNKIHEFYLFSVMNRMPKLKGYCFTVYQVLAMLEDYDFTRADIFIALPTDPKCSSTRIAAMKMNACSVTWLTDSWQGRHVQLVKRGEVHDRSDESESASTVGVTVTESSPTSCSTADSIVAESLTNSGATVSGAALSAISTAAVRSEDCASQMLCQRLHLPSVRQQTSLPRVP